MGDRYFQIFIIAKPKGQQYRSLASVCYQCKVHPKLLRVVNFPVCHC